MSMLRVFIADDEAPARERLKELLQDIAAEVPTEVVGEARHGLEAIELAAGVDQPERELVARAIPDVRSEHPAPVMTGVEIGRDLDLGCGLAGPEPTHRGYNAEHAGIINTFSSVLVATSGPLWPTRSAWELL